MDLLLWRHAEAEDTAPGGDLGRALTARGRAQAERVAAWLGERLPDDAHILVSPAKRCQQTVAPLGRTTTTAAAQTSSGTGRWCPMAAMGPSRDSRCDVASNHYGAAGRAPGPGGGPEGGRR